MIFMYYLPYSEENSMEFPKPSSRKMTMYLTRDTVDEPVGFSVHLTELRPGERLNEHRHAAAAEAMFCLSGRGSLWAEGKSYEFSPDSLMVMMPGETHSVVNLENEPLRLLCIFSPPISAEGMRKASQKA